MNETIAVGIPVFQRTEALERCLQSIEQDAIDRAIIADNGYSEDRQHLYEKNWGFDLTVLDLDYNVGIGSCRAATVNELTEDYLIAIDNDMILPSVDDLQKLLTVLKERPELGGVSGILIEGDRVRSGCTNLHEEPLFFGKKAIVHEIRSEPTVEWVNDKIPIAKFDKLTQATVFRNECLESYSWDPDFPVTEHLDFFLGHYHRTSWEFAVCPSVIFDHQKGRYETYRREVRGGGEDYQQKKTEAMKVFKQKWGYNRYEYGQRVEWIDNMEHSLIHISYRLLQRRLPLRYLLVIKDIIESGK